MSVTSAQLDPNSSEICCSKIDECLANNQSRVQPVMAVARTTLRLVPALNGAERIGTEVCPLTGAPGGKPKQRPIFSASQQCHRAAKKHPSLAAPGHRHVLPAVTATDGNDCSVSVQSYLLSTNEMISIETSNRPDAGLLEEQTSSRNCEWTTRSEKLRLPRNGSSRNTLRAYNKDRKQTAVFDEDGCLKRLKLLRSPATWRHFERVRQLKGVIDKRFRALRREVPQLQLNLKTFQWADILPEQNLFELKNQAT